MRINLRLETTFAVAWLAGALAIAPAPARAQGDVECDPRVAGSCPAPTPPDAVPAAPAAPAPSTAADTAPPAPPAAAPAWEAWPPPGYRPPAQDWLSPEPTYHTERHRRWGLFIAGMTMFGSTWMLTALSAYGSQEGLLAIPVAGPIAYLVRYREQFDCSDPPPGSAYYCRTENSSDRSLYMLLVLDALVQAGGVAMAAAGLFTTTEVRVRDVRFSLRPSVTPTGAGLFAAGVF